MDERLLERLRGDVESGKQSLTAAFEELASTWASWQNSPSSHLTADAHVDLDRDRRCGYPEVVYAEGKSVEAVVDIFTSMQQAGYPALATRANAAQADAVLEAFPAAIYNEVARTVRIPSEKSLNEVGRVAVITAGTSDRPIAEEAMETLRWMECGVCLIQDVGVAGPHRLAERMQEFVSADAIVVIAGMEGALPSVVGGYVACPVIAVPTSVGYGASFGGVTALLGMLNSCASNVTVVNIDAGFKAAYVAGLIAQRRHRSPARTEP